jgi:hypothetical protein
VQSLASWFAGGAHSRNSHGSSSGLAGGQKATRLGNAGAEFAQPSAGRAQAAANGDHAQTLPADTTKRPSGRRWETCSGFPFGRASSRQTWAGVMSSLSLLTSARALVVMREEQRGHPMHIHALCMDIA